MKTFLMLIVALLGSVFGANGQVVTKVVVENNLKYLNAISFANDQISRLPNDTIGGKIGTHWLIDSCVMGTNGVKIGKTIFKVSVENMRLKKDRSLVSTLTFYIGKIVDSKFFALDILHYNYLHQTKSGWITMLKRENTLSSFKPESDSVEIVKLFNEYTGKLGDYIK